MGWRVQYREKDKKYRLWSTISDRWLTEWGTKKDIQHYIAENYLWEHKKQVIEMYLQFPDQWPAKDSATYMTDEAANEEYVAWLETLVHARGTSHYRVIENKYNEVIQELGL